MLQRRDPRRALAHLAVLIFADAEVGQQDGAEKTPPVSRKVCTPRHRSLPSRIGARAAAGGRRLRPAATPSSARSAALGARLDRDLRQVGCRQDALPHLVDALRALGEFQIVGDEHQAERLGSLQRFEQVDDVGFGVLVEVAGRLVGEQQRRRIDQRAGDHRARRCSPPDMLPG